MIKHHLSEPLLMSYSAGTLPEAFNLVVATHIALCDNCRARAESFDAVGGALLEDSAIDDHVAMSHDALSATLAMIDAMPEDRQIRATLSKDAIFPQPLNDYVGGDLDQVNWKNVGGGVRQAILPTDKSASVRLLHIPAGAKVPDHGHRGTELTLVLQGAFRDEQDRFARGDIEIATEDLTHTPVAEMGADCICLAATDAPLRFKGLLPRLAQPFIKI